MSKQVADATNLSHQLRVLKEGAWLVAAITALITAAALGISLRQDALYRASADVFLDSESLSSDLTSTTRVSDPERDISTQARLARLPAVAERALTIAGQRGRPLKLLDESTVTTTGQADILTFSVTAPERALAGHLATSYAKAYTTYRRDLDTKALVAARKRVEDQLSELRRSGVSPTSSLYATFEQRRGELRTLEALRGSKALLVRSASAPLQIQPKPLRNTILAAFLGLFLGAAVVLLREAANTRVRTVEELQDRLGLPLLARIPNLQPRRGASASLTMLTDPRAPEAEAFRVLATNINFTNADRGARTIMVTGANRGEGKSTTVANLAAAFARRGQRVVLVDLDLRHPTIASLFGLEERPGATDVALGDVALEDALVRVPLMDRGVPSSAESANGTSPTQSAVTAPTLEVLPAGTLPPDASEFVGSPRISNLIAKLSSRADLTLIDAPPLLHVSDALALSAHLDALIVVARLSKSRRPVLNELRRVLDTAPIIKLGFLVTGVTTSERYTYGEGYEAGAGAAPARERVG